MAKITQLSQLDLNAEYSYADYLTWLFDATVELIKGKILMNPAPNFNHHYISKNFLVDIGYFLKGKPCQVFHAPFDARLYDRKNQSLPIKTSLSLCSPTYRLFVTRINSIAKAVWVRLTGLLKSSPPSSAQKDTQTKYQLYRETGVKEYWLVYPYEASVSQFVLDEEHEKYQLAQMFSRNDKATALLFPDLAIDLKDIFAH